MIHHSFWYFDVLKRRDWHSSLSPQHTVQPDKVRLFCFYKFFESICFENIHQTQPQSKVFFYPSPKSARAMTSKKLHLISLAHKQGFDFVEIGLDTSNRIDKITYEKDFFALKIKAHLLKIFKSLVFAIALCSLFTFLG